MPWTFDSALLVVVVALLGFALGAIFVWRLGLGSHSLQAQAAILRQDHEWFRTTLASIGDAVIATNADGKVTFLNAVAQTLTGWTQEEARGTSLADVFTIINEKTRQTVDNPGVRALREGAIVGLANHTLLVAKDGAETCIDDSAAPIRDENGGVIGVVLVFRDVSERRRAEVEFAERNQIVSLAADVGGVLIQCEKLPDFLRRCAEAIVQHLDAAFARVWTLNPNENVLELQASAGLYTHIDGAHSRVPVGQFKIGLIAQERKPHLTNAVVGDPRVHNQDWAKQEGMVAFAGYPLIVEDRVVGVMAVFARHILSETALKMMSAVANQIAVGVERCRSSAALLASEESLRDASRRKDEFLATLAHELRNPLAPICNGLHILRLAGNDGKSLAPIQAMMERQLGQMVRLVDDLLDVSRINNGKIELRKEWLDLAAVVESALETSRPLIEAARHEIVVHLPADPLCVTGDLTRLAQVVSNLLNNSAKYTPEGGHLWLTVERYDQQALIRVRDDGMGIPADMLPKIFDMFTQVDRNLKQSQSGLGIGLTLVRRLVEMHDGTVEATSQGVEKGCEFVVSLPLAAEQRNGRPKEQNNGIAASASHRILVVDDNKDSAESLALLLQLVGNEVHVVYDGSSALEAMKQLRPAVVLLDIGLPDMSGHEVARRIRETPEGKDALLIAQTGWGQEKDRLRSTQAGFDAHLVKPLDLATLQDVLAKLDRAPLSLYSGAPPLA